MERETMFVSQSVVDGWFVTNANRGDGVEYLVRSDTAPEWLSDAVQEAHDGEFPDDWRYQKCAEILSALAEAQTYRGEDRSDLASSLVDCFSADLLGWLHANPARAGYADDARSQGFVNLSDPSVSFMDWVSAAQYVAIDLMVAVLGAAWDEFVLNVEG